VGFKEEEMSGSVATKQSQGFLSTLLVGSIIAWHRHLLGADSPIPGPPPGWVECNGQKLEDLESLLDGQTIPDLNGRGLFIRGNSISGEYQDDELKSHAHGVITHTNNISESRWPEWGAIDRGGEPYYPVPNPYVSAGNIIGDTGGAETRPANMSVVWIMKVKQVAAAQAVPVVQAAPNAPLGIVYVNQEGNVGIGMTEPTCKLDVEGSIRATGSLATGNYINTPGGADLVLSPGGEERLRIRASDGAILHKKEIVHADYVFEPSYQLESLEEHAEFMWKNKHLKAIPRAEVDGSRQEVVELGMCRRGIVEELEKAHIYIEQLHRRIRGLEERLAKGGDLNIDE
jgi:hypothetical protein